MDQALDGMKEMKILMVGLDEAGKTTILYRLKLGKEVTTIPTLGFNNETVKHRNINFTFLDVGGLSTIRALWNYYYQNTQGLIYIVDSSNRERIAEARIELEKIVEKYEMSDVPILLYANKQDLPNAMTATEVFDKLGLANLTKTCYAQAACSTTGSGLYEGLDWLADELNKRH